MDVCPICIDDITCKIQLNCNHEFCDKCIKKYKSKGGICCPCCRKPFKIGRRMSKKDQILLLRLQHRWLDLDDSYDLQINYTNTSRIMTMRYNDIEHQSVVDRC